MNDGRYLITLNESKYSNLYMVIDEEFWRSRLALRCLVCFDMDCMIEVGAQDISRQLVI